jgi:hypothetical protein
MAINFKDARQKLADAARISTQLNDIIATDERFIRNTKDSANKAKQSRVLGKTLSWVLMDSDANAKTRQKDRTNHSPLGRKA